MHFFIGEIATTDSYAVAHDSPFPQFVVFTKSIQNKNIKIKSEIQKKDRVNPKYKANYEDFVFKKEGCDSKADEVTPN